MVALLCEGLAGRGHQVTLMAAEGSRDYGRLITHPWAGRKPYPYRAWCKLRFQALSLWAARHADVVINFGRVDYLVSPAPDEQAAASASSATRSSRP